jgi:hypothetical protein
MDDCVVDFSVLTGVAAEIHFYQNSQEITSIHQGTIECQVSLNSNIGTQSGIVIVALYKQSEGQVEMVDAVTSNAVLNDSGSIMVNPSLNVPMAQQDEQYFIKVFVWNDLASDGMLATVKTFNNNGLQ